MCAFVCLYIFVLEFRVVFAYLLVCVFLMIVSWLYDGLAV